jgi:TonB family protein
MAGLSRRVTKALGMSAVMILCALAAVVETAAAQEPPTSSSSLPSLPDWKTYTVKGEEFSVSLPVMPAMTTQTMRDFTLNKQRQQRVIGAYADGVVYVILTFENSKWRQSLKDLIAEMPGDHSGMTRNLTLGSFSGREYEFQDGDRRGVSQFYITDRNIYLFKAVGSGLGNPDMAIPKFLSSIRLEKRPKGIELVDGPGEQWNSNPSKTNEDSEARVFSGKEVTRKASVFTKPEPSYSEAARKNQLTGTVVLRAVFTSSGAVANIKAVSGLPFGLTEQAIAAAKQLKFIPAIKDGHFVSMFIQLEYNFNLY